MIIAIDQSTSATKALLFDDNCKLIKQVGVPHKQYYPKPGWVEHDAEEIFNNTLKAISELPIDMVCGEVSVAITNQRETVVVWDRETGKPVYNAVVWQCLRGQEICDELKAKGDAPSYEKVLEDIKVRDYNDSHRAFAPLKQADDAILADTTGMNFEESVEFVCKAVKERL